MLKRMWAIVISVVMLVSLCPTTSVFATASKSDNLITEDFENGTINTAIAELNPSYTMTKQVADGVGKGGGKALEITSLSSGAVLGFNVPTFAYATEDAFLSYDFQFSKFPENIDDGSMMYLAGVKLDGGTSTITVVQQTEDGVKNFYFANQTGVVLSEAIALGKWYKITYVKNNNVIFGTVIDDDGEIIAFNRRTGAGAQTEYSLVRGSSKTLGDGKVLVDNVKFNWFNKSTYGPSVSQFIIDRAADGTVSRNAKSALIVFDQAIATNPTATLTPEGGTAISCTVTKEDNKDYASSFMYRVSWTTDLVAGTSYTLTLSGNNAQSVAIDSTGVISFSTEEATLAETVLRDDFEDASEFSSDSLYDKDYSRPFSSGTTVHGAFQVAGYSGTDNAIEIRFDPSKDKDTDNDGDIDYYGSRATLYSSVPYVFGANNAVVVTYKMKISNAAIDGTEGAYTGGNNVWIGTSTTNSAEVKSQHVLAAIDLDGYTGEHYIGKGSNSSASSLAGKQGYYYDEDKWYNVTFTVDGTKETFTLTDIDTGAVLWENSKSFSYTSTAGYYIGVVSMNTRDKGENGEGAAVTIDDIALWQIDKSKANHALTASATANANTATLTFNQPTTVTEDMLAVSTDSEGNTPVEADIDVKYTDFDANVVTISGLEYGESYYLDYSAVTSAGGAAIASGDQATSLVQFTMPEPTVSVMDKAVFENGSVKLNYWAKSSESTGAFIAAFYRGTTLVDVALLANQALSPNRNSVSFVAADVPADADGMIVYALDGLGSLVPLCVPTAKVSIN